jgi:chemotaxis protein CheD
VADIEVPTGEAKVAQAGDTLVAMGIGSCIVIALYAPKRKIGALAHAMLSPHHSARIAHEPQDTMYIDSAVDEMLNKLYAKGAKRQYLEAKIIGGANMFSAYTSDIAESNISYAREKLKNEGITIVGECVGGSQGRSVEFSVASGIVTVKTKF